MPRFVLLYHAVPDDFGRESHWDLMFEVSGSLRTWALNNDPNTGHPVKAVSLQEHRMEYLTYEGPVSRNRGSVRRIDSGTFEFVTDTAGEVVVRMEGDVLIGTIRLEKMPGNADDEWQVTYEPTENRNSA